MRRFLFDSIECDENHVDFGELLSRAYRSKVRPLCLCRPPGLPMAVADIGGQLVIKRMPLSGSGHDPACSCYEPPYELSGLGHFWAMQSSRTQPLESYHCSSTFTCPDEAGLWELM